VLETAFLNFHSSALAINRPLAWALQRRQELFLPRWQRAKAASVKIKVNGVIPRLSWVCVRDGSTFDFVVGSGVEVFDGGFFEGVWDGEFGNAQALSNGEHFGSGARRPSSGRSLAQEVERRIERSLDFDRHLVIAKGDYWSPVLIAGDDIWIGLGDDPRDYPVPPDDPPHEENVVVLKVTPEDRKRLRNYFNGAPYPYDFSNEEIEAAGDAWIEMQRDIKRGK
jgi:hypothetical protein